MSEARWAYIKNFIPVYTKRVEEGIATQEELAECNEIIEELKQNKLIMEHKNLMLKLDAECYATSKVPMQRNIFSDVVIGFLTIFGIVWLLEWLFGNKKSS